MLNNANIANFGRNTTPQITVTRDELADLSLRELASLFDVTKCLVDILLGFSCQPRFNNDKGHNAPGEFVERAQEFFCEFETLIADTAAKAECNSRDDVERKYTIAIHRSLGDSLADTNIICAEGVHEYQRQLHLACVTAKGKSA